MGNDRGSPANFLSATVRVHVRGISFVRENRHAMSAGAAGGRYPTRGAVRPAPRYERPRLSGSTSRGVRRIKGSSTLWTNGADAPRMGGGSVPYYWRYGRRDRHALLLKVERSHDRRMGPVGRPDPASRTMRRSSPHGEGSAASARHIRHGSRGYIAEPYVWRMFDQRSPGAAGNRGLAEGERLT